MVTLGIWQSVLNREVFSFQGYIRKHIWDRGVLISVVSIKLKRGSTVAVVLITFLQLKK